mmetsp:Transcript_3214/g.6663  ORF Transcript_3214/g.6663 Transcript_3214/m.6663 type:complete len:163 (-) Transcript_3214:119-607(-)
MKLIVSIVTIVVPAVVSAFAPSMTMKESNRSIVRIDSVKRRDVLFSAAMTGGFGFLPGAFAMNTIPADNEIVKEQRTIVNKLDINNSPVADYMQFPGMYPTIGGKIANNGPYKTVRDVYKVQSLSKAEKTKIREFEKYFTATKSTGLDTMRGRDPYRKSFNK